MIRAIGPYRVLEEIGRGGMGIVYLAEREDDFQQRVAIKIVPALADDLMTERFREERRILASMNHPAIARFLDSGVTPDGLPYIVMEYVDGRPIDRYAREQALSTPERLELFLRACEAVSHAHRRLIVHCDIKPSNILVTRDGLLRLLDFGVARLIGSDEAITTSVDVYALGILLGDLIQDTAPNAQHADLDAVVQKAVSPDPARRYASVELLADDVRNVLDGRPVAARRPTRWYVASRFARRHRAAVGAAVVGAVTLASFVIALIWSAAAARHERDVAERVTTMLVQVFSGSDPRTPEGAALTARELVDSGTEGIRRNLDLQPDLEAYVNGDRSGGHAADTGSGVAGAIDSLPAALALQQLATKLSDSGQLAVAEPVARRAVEMVQRMLGPQDPQTALMATTLASIVYARGRRDEAERMFVENADVFRASLGPEHPMVGTSLHSLGVSRRDRGDMAGADRLLREALSIRERVLALARSESLSVLADVARRQGRDAEADQLSAEVASLRAELSRP